MKKIIGLVVALMTIVNISVLAQCGTATLTSTPYGDNTPCKNSQGNYYYLPNTDGCNVDSYKWFGPDGSTITDGVLTAPGNTGLATDSSKIWVRFKTKSGAIQVYPVNSCGQNGVSSGLQVSLTCAAGSTTPAPTTYLPDTALSGLSVYSTTTYMRLSFTPLAIATGYLLYVKSATYYPNSVCYNGEYWRQAGSVYPTSPIYVQWGWTPMTYNASYNCRIRMGTSSGQVIWSDEFVLNTTLTP